MCGRFSLATTPQQIEQELPFLTKIKDEQIKVNYNVAPTQASYIIVDIRPDELHQVRWGLIPHWSRDGSQGGKLYNARMETITTKPSFRIPIRQRRCIVLADSFYEWKTDSKGDRIPHRIKRADDKLLYMAGIWDSWENGNETIPTFTIVTVPANNLVTSLHHRMPAVLPTAEACHNWLHGTEISEVLNLLVPAPEDLLTFYRVSQKVNSVAHNGMELHTKVEEPPNLFKP